jgi:hypothetical protein
MVVPNESMGQTLTGRGQVMIRKDAPYVKDITTEAILEMVKE